MKTQLEKIGLPFVHRLDPEVAHGVALRAMRMGLTTKPGPITSPRLASTVAGLTLPNPVGLAAGFDKNAVAVARFCKPVLALLRWAPPPLNHNPATRNQDFSA